MSHNRPAEIAAGILHSAEESYGTPNDNPTKAAPLVPATQDVATVQTTSGDGRAQASGVGKNMRGK